MRWSAHLAGIPSEEQERLVNLITLGLGRLGRTLRLHGREVGLGELLGSLAASQDLLRAALVMIAPAESGGLPADTDAPPDTAALSWQRYLRELPSGDAARLVQALEWVVVQGQRLGDTVLADGDLTMVTAHLHDIDQGILGARRQIMASLVTPEGGHAG